MILIILGTQKFQFNRLIKKVDKLIEDDQIKDSVIAQIGYSNYKPINYKFSDFFDQSEFDSLINKSDIIITHGGVGGIVSSLKKNKKIIVVPRLKKYREHIDDHQLEIARAFQRKNLVILNENLNELCNDISKIESFEPIQYVKDNKKIICEIKKIISKVK